MATTASIIALLKFYATRQKNASVSYADFCDYLKRYAELHFEEQPGLSQYLTNPIPALMTELEKLISARQVVLVGNSADIKALIVIPYYLDYFADRYKDILKTPGIPFPTMSDLPKQTPTEVVQRIPANELLYKLLTSPDASFEPTLYGVLPPNNSPTILLPSTVPVKSFIEACLGKILGMLSKEEQHDYFLKKITISNPGKEMTSRTFFDKVTKGVQGALELLKASNDTFYLWNQLCYFIRKDYEKIKDFTAEDISLLQAVYITEIVSNFYKDKTQENETREAAIKSLEQQLNKPPYYFSLETIFKFVDARGIPLLGQYNDEDLKEYLQQKSTESAGNELPELLVFKTEMDKRFFIFKNKVIPLILRLCGDARETIRETIKNHWMAVLRQYDILPEMRDQKAFERRLEKEIQIQSPILYALLTASFLPLIHYEDPAAKVSFLDDGKLIPYADILMMNRAQLLSDAKILLPFWYTTPVISWIARLLFRPAKSKRIHEPKRSAQKYREEEDEKSRQDNEAAAFTKNKSISRKVAIREGARAVESELVPASSTLDRELESYRRQWNHLLGKNTSENLTEDVNSLIRDYVRRVLKTIKSNGVTRDRVQSLAETLVKTPSMQKIHDHDALLMYTELYMIKLIKNMPM